MKSELKQYFELDKEERSLISKFPGMNWKTVLEAWHEFSETRCASFLYVSDSTFEEFKEWVERG